MKGNKFFDSKIQIGNRFALEVNDSEIKNETMFFNSDLEFAYSQGQSITRSFIDNLPPDWLSGDVVFDSRVHMLMPGWYPAIPGYHHDDVPRPEIPVGQHFITAGQPDYDSPRYKSEHILGLVNSQVCPTHFALGECVMPEVPDGELIYRKWHSVVEELLNEGKLEKFEAPDRTLI